MPIRIARFLPLSKPLAMTRSILTRREMLRRGLAGSAAVYAAAAFETKGLFAEDLTATPTSTEGPFYPDKLPLDTDNDLIVINDDITPAVGQVTYLSGVVRDTAGTPIPGVTVEIWQTDANGNYLHTRGAHTKRDANFQGFGRSLTGPTGEYLFRTIKPVKYPGRTPHIHVAVKKGDRRLLTTQFYIAGEKANANDGLYKRIGGEKLQQLVTLAFKPLPGAKAGEMFAKGDLVLGATPDENIVRRR